MKQPSLQRETVEERTAEPPSRLADLADCSRRYWYRTHHLATWEERLAGMEQHIDLLEPEEEWLYEVTLPSGARLDAWNREEYIAVEYKTIPPREAHLLQATAYHRELNELYIGEAQVQIWYPAFLERSVHYTAAQYGLEGTLNAENYAAIVLPEDITPWYDLLDRYAGDAAVIRQLPVPPERYNPYEPVCQYCPLFDICQL